MKSAEPIFTTMRRAPSSRSAELAGMLVIVGNKEYEGGAKGTERVLSSRFPNLLRLVRRSCSSGHLRRAAGNRHRAAADDGHDARGARRPLQRAGDVPAPADKLDGHGA